MATKYGMVKTDHILFIASGAFHFAKPSDLIPELQGRFPIRVELDRLTFDDFVEILTHPDNALTKQYQALLKMESVDLRFTTDGLEEMARRACDMNERHENIGARRLQTVMERVLDEVSYTASDRFGERIEIDAPFVEKNIGDLARNADLSRFVL